MAIGKLYISHPNYDFERLDSEWLTGRNLGKILDSPEVKTYHTSIADCDLKIGEIEEKLLSRCQNIECLDLSWNTVVDQEDHDRYAELAYLLSTKYKDITIGTEELYQDTLSVATSLRAVRKTGKDALWVAGCSFSSATGVENSERWGHLVADQLNLEEVNLAIAGGSIWDASDQLLRSDIQKDDIVVWSLTTSGRVDIIHDRQLKSFPFKQAEDSNYFKKHYLFSNTQYALAMRQIQQVMRHIDRIGARLYIINMLDQGWLSLMLRDHETFLDLRSEFDDDALAFRMIDYGSDGHHPGPRQHESYAKEIIKFIQGE